MTYSSITATTDYKKIRTILKIVSLSVLISVMLYEISHVFLLGVMSTRSVWHVGLVIPAGLYNFIQIMGYGKHDILKLMHPPGTKNGIVSMIKSLFYHGSDLILVPTFVSIMLILSLSSQYGLFTLVSMIFAAVYIIQMLPLKFKQDIYTKQAYSAIIEARDEMKTSRMLWSLPDATEDEINISLRQHIIAEEMISVHSVYLQVSMSMFSVAMGTARLLLPITGTTLSAIYQIMLVVGG